MTSTTQLAIDFTDYKTAPRPAGATPDERAAAFVELNPWLMPTIARLTEARVAVGHTRVSMRALIERIRWDFDTVGPGAVTADRAIGEPWRIDNNLQRPLTDIFRTRYPELGKHITRKPTAGRSVV